MGDSILAINIFDFSGDTDFKSIRKTFYQDALVKHITYRL